MTMEWLSLTGDYVIGVGPLFLVGEKLFGQISTSVVEPAQQLKLLNGLCRHLSNPRIYLKMGPRMRPVPLA